MLLALCLAVLLAANGVLATAEAPSSTKSVLTGFLTRGLATKNVHRQQQVQTSVQQLEPNVVLHQQVPPATVAQPVLEPQPTVVVGQQVLVPSPGGQHPFYGPGPYGPLPAAVQSRRYVQIVPYINQVAHVQPQIIEVDAITAPVQFLFRSASGPLLFQQVHLSQAPQAVQHTRSEEKPQLLSHEVYKPVVQELREVIQPFRRITQEIKPVVEEVHTLVAKGDRPVVALSVDEQGSAQQPHTSASTNQQVLTASSSSTTSTTTSQVSGLKTSQVVEQKSESVSEY